MCNGPRQYGHAVAPCLKYVEQWPFSSLRKIFLKRVSTFPRQSELYGLPGSEKLVDESQCQGIHHFAGRDV